jgi:glycosyltransferase involved in cell wall biosynthesis
MSRHTEAAPARLTRTLNELLGDTRLGRRLKGYLRARSPALVVRLKAGFGSLADEATWARALPPDEREQLYLVRQFDPQPAEVAANRELNARFLAERPKVRTVNWLIPPFDHAFGGIYTILRFAARLQTAHGLENRVVVYDYPGADIVNPIYPDLDIERMRAAIARAFPALAAGVTLHSGSGMDDLPAADASVATYWTSAYLLSKVKNARAKFYFIQDYEPSFAAGGTKFGLIDTTYRLGLLRLVNTPGLLDWIELLHGAGGTAFVPSVDTNVYRPPADEPAPRADDTRDAAPRAIETREVAPRADDALDAAPRTGETRPVKIFFYGRPGAARNGFMLGLEALRRVKARYGEGVRVVAAGAEWSPVQYGVTGVVENLGLLKSLEEVAALYRSCDIGLVFMFSKHPSYQPFEFMASGCAVVTNENRATGWLLRHEENALLCEPTAEDVAQTVGRLVEDGALRRRLRAEGLRSVAQKSWDETIDDACRRAGLLPA